MRTSLIYRLSKNLFFRVGVLLCACTALVFVTIIGFNQHFDTKYLYVAGLSWWKGLNAYDPDVASRLGANQSAGSFFYPPQIAPLCLLLGAFSWTQAKVMMTLLNVFCTGILAFFGVLLVKQPQVKQVRVPGSSAEWFIPAIVIANPFTLNIILLGQTTLIVAAALVSGWYYAYRKRWVLSGVLIAISTIKPQLSLLIILWLILERRWRLLAVAAMTTLIFCLVPMVITGPIDVFAHWFSSLGKHKDIFANVLGSPAVFSIQNLLYTMGMEMPQLLFLGIVITGLVWRYRSRLIMDDVIGLLMAISVLFGFAHHYDLIALAPLMAAFWRHLSHRPKATLVALTMMFIMFFPRNVLMTFIPSELLLQYRVLLVIGVTIWLGVMSVKRKAEIWGMS
ncbi:MAG: glycosyltransferase family 87 protein [Coleofasciculus sp. G3-WIS-01]|uniref:glycosyltransferase family 87 protein n=1 Tax=Coleofasciculus sp. G3-WIS-01 TaxID=3069528 RepID=UPI0032FCCBCE